MPVDRFAFVRFQNGPSYPATSTRPKPKPKKKVKVKPWRMSKAKRLAKLSKQSPEMREAKAHRVKSVLAQVEQRQKVRQKVIDQIAAWDRRKK